MSKKKLFFFIFLLFFFFGCGRREEKVKSFSKEPIVEELPLQKVENFILEGFTERGEKHWEVKADFAKVEGNLVKMEKVKAVVWGKEGKVDIEGRKGEYNKQEQKICLNEDVSIKTSEGTKLLTDRLIWDAQKEEANSDVKVVVERENMVVEGKGAVALMEMKKVEVKESVKVRVEPTTVITCKGPLEIDYDKKIAKFYEEVKVEDQQGQLYADRIDVFFNAEDKKIDKVFAYGNVKIFHGGNVAYAEEAVYETKGEKVILRGSPKLVIERE